MTKAYILINYDLRSEKDIIALRNKVDGVKEAHGTLGLYDIVVQIESDSEEKIQDIVTGTPRKMSKINSTVTLTRSEYVSTTMT